jgi:hypothetical protein
LDRIKSQDRKTYGEIQNFSRELEKRADLGVPLHGERPASPAPPSVRGHPSDIPLTVWAAQPNPARLSRDG